VPKRENGSQAGQVETAGGSSPAEWGPEDPSGFPFALPEWIQEVLYGDGRLTLTDYEAARLLGLSRGSVRQAIAEGSIHSVRLGRRLLIPVIPLLAMLSSETEIGEVAEPEA